MHEIFPVAAGAAIGLATFRFVPVRLRWIVLVVLGVAAGVLASAISGELELSLGFIPVDIAQVLIAAVLTYLAARAWQQRTSRI
jgi:hypothetical protein